MWMRRSSIRAVRREPAAHRRHARRADAAFYVDAEQGFAYEKAIADDLVKYVDRVFPTKAERGGRAIGGLSMGGYGALRLALGRPDLFCSANSHSGAVAFGHKPQSGTDAFSTEFRRVLGETPSAARTTCSQ
jgi:S-formylglutathione hydrolase FrmB